MTQGYSKALPLDTDINLAANSDQLACSQKAVKTYIGNKAVDVVTHAATSKTTPVDADELPIVDSAASNILKKLTWTNLKATLKAYFDTLYPSGDSAALTSWTPTFTNFTLGNGSYTAVYKRVGKLVFYTLDITMGSTSSVTAGQGILFTLPVTQKTRLASLKIGEGWSYQSTATPPLIYLTAQYIGASSAVRIDYITVSGAVITNAILGGGSTYVASGAQISITGEYEAA